MKRGIFMSSILFFIVTSTFLASAIDILFNEKGTTFINLTFSSSQITEFTFNISGSLYNNSYPSNVSLDFGNDNIIDWEYKVYHSNEPVVLDSILNVWSDTLNSNNIYFVDLIPNTEIFDLIGLAKIQNNTFQQISSVQGGILGLTSIGNLKTSILSITTNSGVIHALLPSVTTLAGTIGLYISRGGSTYFCNSDHSFTFTSQCDLSYSDALTSSHLARQASFAYFNFTEPVRNPKILDMINEKLKTCSLPCSIPIKINSDSAGNISLREISEIFESRPAEIELTEGSVSYSISITPHLPLTNISYAYGVIPNVYIVPIIASDETRNLTPSQLTRIMMLNNTLAQGWDNLTNFSHPLNFTFFLTPYKLPDFKKQSNYASFSLSIFNFLLPKLDVNSPAILVVLDVWDYFSSLQPFTTRRSLGSSTGLISDIYVNGFTDPSKTNLEAYDSEILKNIVLHEIAHTFIGYPPADSQKVFYSDHPASFSQLLDFNTYSITNSPIGSEGYYEIYSVMNQIRIYVPNSRINNTPLKLSQLDKMLLGTLSPEIEENYTFFMGNISKQENTYVATSMTPNLFLKTKSLYPRSTDYLWWDIRTVSSKIDLRTRTSFTVPKSGQNNKALFVFASDLINKNHFRVFNVNSHSTTKSVHFSSRPLIIIEESKWDMTETTRFSSFNLTQLQNLSNVTFSSFHGKVEYKVPLNISFDRDIRDKIKVESKKIFIDSTSLPEFNKPARLIFKNISFQHPIIKKDGSDCISECYNITLNKLLKTFHFEVFGFSTYEIVEQCSDGIKNYDETGIDCGGSCNECSSSPTPGGGSGGGNGGGNSGGGSGGNNEGNNSSSSSNKDSSSKQSNSKKSDGPFLSNNQQENNIRDKSLNGSALEKTKSSESLSERRSILTLFGIKDSTEDKVILLDVFYIALVIFTISLIVLSYKFLRKSKSKQRYKILH